MFVRPVFYTKRIYFATSHLRKFSSSAESYIVSHVQKGIANIVMDHPPTRNTLSIKMMEELIKKLDEYGSNIDVRVIILGATGKIFSAGHNMQELNPAGGKEKQEKVFNLATELMYKMIDCPVPIIAKVDGMAAAAGCQLVAQCDMAFCSKKSTFSTPGVHFGVFCSTPGVALARSIPKMCAMKMLLTGLPISSKDAEEKGLVNKATDNLDHEIKTVCDAILEKSRAIIEIGKRFYYKQIDSDIKTAYKIGGEIMVAALQTPDGQEGVKSFLEKRNRKWTHR